MGRLLTLLRPKGDFSPADLPGLALWLDASDESTITHSSGAVSQWDDKSGNARHVVQATASRQPTTGADNLNGKNVLTFDGAEDFLRTSAAATISQPNTIVAVFQRVTSNGVIIDSNGSTNRQYVRTGAAVLRAAADIELDGTADLSVPSVAVFVANGASGSLRHNGALIRSGDFGAKSFALATIGASAFGNLWFGGVIAEVLVYSGALSPTDVAALELYATRWGVTLA